MKGEALAQENARNNAGLVSAQGRVEYISKITRYLRARFSSFTGRK